MEAKLEIISLDFDSQLFGYPVGKYHAANDWDEKAFVWAVKPFQLVYIFTANPLNTTNPTITPVDKKITFTKGLSKITTHTSANYITETWRRELEDLALESGKYSRFKTDKRLQNGEFEKLYKYWIQKALDRKEVIIEQQEGSIKGMITLEINRPTAKIGLIAVDSAHRGQGVAQKLLHVAAQHAHSKGCQQLQVSTQANNVPACNLYQNAGFALVDSVYIYHYFHSLW